MNVRQCIDALERLVPLKLAGDWDNVGLLLEGPNDRPVRRILLTIDYTDAVFVEAVEKNIDLVIAYHPPIFGGVKRLTRTNASTRLLLETIEAGLTLWSPHTALDAMKDGVCDWLGSLVGTAKKSKPIEPASDAPDLGAGRTLTLTEPVPLKEIHVRLTTALGLPGLRVAQPVKEGDNKLIRTVALCPGAGGSLFQAVHPRDLFLTGEMRHHDVLSRVAQGSAVILTEHSNSERGYLNIFAEKVAESTGATVLVSECDKDPLSLFLPGAD